MFIKEKEEHSDYLGELSAREVTQENWDKSIDGARTALGAPNNRTLFPPYYLKSTFEKIGGRLLLFEDGEEFVSAAFLFPKKKRGEYIARIHITLEVSDKRSVEKKIAERLDSLLPGQVEVYNPEDKKEFHDSHETIGGFDIGRPSKEEAGEIRHLQKKIWLSEGDYLYPEDIHSVEFGLPTSLVVRKDGSVTGFLFGFYKEGKADLPKQLSRYRSDVRIESQLMGFPEKLRGWGLGYQLKKKQAEDAVRENIDIVEWTVDPLQIGNAVLNFGKLRAICYTHYEDYYSFRNKLNRVGASRLGITWVPSSGRARKVLEGDKKVHSKIINLETLDGVGYTNRGINDVNLKIRNARWLAIELPVNWTEMQSQDINMALKYRSITDKIFQTYLGEGGRGYAVCEVGKSREKYYLLAKKFEEIEGL